MLLEYGARCVLPLGHSDWEGGIERFWGAHSQIRPKFSLNKQRHLRALVRILGEDKAQR